MRDWILPTARAPVQTDKLRRLSPRLAARGEPAFDSSGYMSLMSESLTTTEMLCTNCRSPIPSERFRRRPPKYCSTRCKSRAVKKAARERGENKRVTPIQHTPLAPERYQRGSVAEMLVCAHLLGRGHEVFRAVNHQCPYDLIVEINGILYRTEVKTGHPNNQWSIGYTTVKRGKRYKDLGLVAVVVSPHDIRFKPPLESLEHVMKLDDVA